MFAKFIRIKGPREAWAADVKQKICPGGRDLPNVENLPKGCLGGW